MARLAGEIAEEDRRAGLTDRRLAAVVEAGGIGEHQRSGLAGAGDHGFRGDGGAGLLFERVGCQDRIAEPVVRCGRWRGDQLKRPAVGIDIVQIERDLDHSAVLAVEVP